MTTVSAKVGLTLKIFKDSQYEFIRPEIGIEGIDIDKPLEPQLKLAKAAIDATWDFVDDQINEKVITQMPNIENEMKVQVATKLNQHEVALKKIATEVAELKKNMC
jgi:hypothetical protein